MKTPKVEIPAAVPVTYPTTGGSYIGNDATGELILVPIPVTVAVAEDAPDTTASKEQI